MAERNPTNHTIGEIEEIEKKGHELLWVQHKKDLDNITSKVKVKPQYVYVEQVLEEEDFSQLNLPGTQTPA